MKKYPKYRPARIRITPLILLIHIVDVIRLLIKASLENPISTVTPIIMSPIANAKLRNVVKPVRKCPLVIGTTINKTKSGKTQPVVASPYPNPYIKKLLIGMNPPSWFFENRMGMRLLIFDRSIEISATSKIPRMTKKSAINGLTLMRWWEKELPTRDAPIPKMTKKTTEPRPQTDPIKTEWRIRFRPPFRFPGCAR